jgi:tetratricopeptide (TPR) repeat protein
VAKALRVTLLGEDEARIENLASTDVDNYDVYLKARDELYRGGYVNLDRAQGLFQRVLAEDPSYTPARLGLVLTWAQMAKTGAISIQEALDRGLPLLEPIVEAEPDNPEALRLMADYRDGASRLPGDAGLRDEAERFYQRALELEPRNAVTLKAYGRFLYGVGQVRRGVELMDRAVVLDPYNVDVLWDSCQTSAHLGELEKALTACRRIQELEPDGPQGYYGEALAHAYAGDLAHTLFGYREAIERDPEDFEMVAAMGIFWTALGDAEQAEAWLQRAEAIGAGQPVPTSARMLLFAFNEQYDRAGDLAARALSRRMDDRHGTQFLFRRTLAQHALRSGAPDRALAAFREALPWAFEADLRVPAGGAEWDEVINLAAVLKQSDPLSERPGALLTLVEEHVNDYYPGAGKVTEPLRRAAVHALRGESEPAIEQLKQAQTFMPMPYWRGAIPDAPAFFGLRDNPDFQTIVTELEAEAARQREEARELLGVDA